MNYYPRFPGDYMRKTMHLSMLEDGAYTRLLDWYYANDKPIPHERRYAVSRANGAAERKAVDAVLAEFFVLTGDAHHNERADKEIEAATKRIEAARENGRKGGRRPNENPAGNPVGSDPANPEGNPAESSLTPYSLRSEKKEPNGSSSSGPTIPCPYAQIVEAYHLALPSLPRVRLTSPSRQKAMRGFWGWVLGSKKSDGTPRATNGDEALAWISSYFARASENDFLMGRNKRSGEHQNWTADFDFLLTEKGKKHVIERTQEAA